MFPLRIAFDPEAITEWQRGYVESNPSRWGIWGPFQSQVLKNISDYRLPVIRLAKETPKEAVCTVFEKVNTGGVPLNVFELLTATYAGDTEYFDAHGSDFQLPAHWKQVQDELAEHPMLRRRGQRLPAGRLPGVDPPSAARSTGCRSVHAACGELQAQRHPGPPAAGVHPVVTADRVGPALDRRVPRPPRGLRCRRIFPTAARSRRSPRSAPCSAPGPTRGRPRRRSPAGTGAASSGSSTAARPTPGSPVTWNRSWAGCGVAASPPRSLEANFPAARLNTMSSRNSAAYKGVLALLLRQGAIDWTYSKEPINPTIFEDQQVDVALILPQDVVRQEWCQPRAHGQHRQQDAADQQDPPDHGKSGSEPST